MQKLFTDNLSSRVRNYRQRQKNKSIAVGTVKTTKTIGKVNSIGKTVERNAINDISKEEYANHTKELKDAFLLHPKKDKKHMMVLLKETHKTRRRWIGELGNFSLKPIYEEFPCFEDAEYVS